MARKKKVDELGELDRAYHDMVKDKAPAKKTQAKRKHSRLFSMRLRSFSIKEERSRRRAALTMSFSVGGVFVAFSFTMK